MAGLTDAFKVGWVVGTALALRLDVVHCVRLRELSFSLAWLAQITVSFPDFFSQLAPLPTITAFTIIALALLPLAPVC